MDVDVTAGPDRSAGNSDHLTVLDDAFAADKVTQRELVSKRDRLAHRHEHASQPHLLARRERLHGHRDVVARMQDQGARPPRPETVLRVVEAACHSKTPHANQMSRFAVAFAAAVASVPAPRQ